MTAQDAPTTLPTLPFGSISDSLSEHALPEGWSIVDYPGKLGNYQFAVFANGRRLVSGMTSAQSAARWAQLMAQTRG